MNDFETACEQLAMDGIETVASRYDTGEDALAFHNSNHTKDVYTGARTLSELARHRVSTEDRALLGVAAGWHDSVHGRKDNKNEEMSAEEAARAMWDCSYGFTKKQIQRVGELIMATVTTVTANGIRQAVDEHDYVSGILADADLCALGMTPDEAIPRITSYYIESAQMLPKIGGHFMNFLLGEESLLKKHLFHTEEAQREYDNLHENAEAVRSLMRRYSVQ